MSTIFARQESDQFAPGLLSICCPRCENSLTMHQPDPQLPDRLLATCDDCKSWFLATGEGVDLTPLADFHREPPQIGNAFRAARPDFHN